MRTKFCTRSVYRKYKLCIENINRTLDPIQVNFETESGHVATWRFVLWMRYVDNIPEELTSNWFDHDVNHNTLPTTVPSADKNVPHHVHHTHLQVFNGKRKLFTITVFYTTFLVRIQGKACKRWVNAEFDKLKCLVNMMAPGSCPTRSLPVLSPPKQSPKKSPKGHHKLALRRPPKGSPPQKANSSPSLIIDSESDDEETTPFVFAEVENSQGGPSKSDTHLEDLMTTNNGVASSPIIAEVGDGQGVITSVGSSSNSSSRPATQPGATDSTSRPLESDYDAADPKGPSLPISTLAVPPHEYVPGNHAHQPPSSEACEQSKSSDASDNGTDDLAKDGDPTVTCSFTSAATQCSPDPARCVRCSRSLQPERCYECMIEMFQDLKAQMDSKHKLLKQNFKAELMDLKQENETLRQQISVLSSKLGKIDAIESRQKQMLAKQKNDAEIRASASKENVEPTPLSKSTVSPAQPNTSTAKPATEPHVAKPVPQGSTPVSAANLASSHEKTDSSTTKQLQEALNMAAGTVKDNLHTPPPHPKPFNIRLPPSGKIASLLIGDSNLQRVDQRRLDPSGSICVRTLRGVKAGQLAASLGQCSPREDVSRVVVHVGTNDCASHHSVDTIITDFKHLAVEVRRVFPFSTVAFTAILPQGRSTIETVSSVNKRLSELCASDKIQFLSEKAFYTQAGSVAPGLFNRDKLHLNENGVALLLRQVKRFMCSDGQRHRPHPTNTLQRQPADQRSNTGSARSHDLHRDQPCPAHQSLAEQCLEPVSRSYASAAATVRHGSDNSGSRSAPPTATSTSSAIVRSPPSSGFSATASTATGSDYASVVFSSCAPRVAAGLHTESRRTADSAGPSPGLPGAGGVWQPSFRHGVSPSSPDYHLYAGNMAHAPMPWHHQVAPHGLPVSFPVHQPPYIPFQPPVPHWQIPFFTGGLRHQAVI